MRTSVHATSLTPLPLIPKSHPPVFTRGEGRAAARKQAFRSALVAVPIAAAAGRLLGSRRTATAAGGIAALALGALRWQMSRWFTETSTYTVDARLGALELRSYPALVEARAVLEAAHLEAALDLGFGRLACYIYGANASDEDIAMTAPILTSRDDGAYAMSIAMPPGRTRASLPQPAHPSIALREVPARRIAALRFSGRFTHENIARAERELMRRVARAGLVTRGAIAFAGYDSPATLPLLRRNEVWLELA